MSVDIVNLNFPTNSFDRSPENWSSPSLRSGESLDSDDFIFTPPSLQSTEFIFSTLHSEKNIFGFGKDSSKTVDYPTNTFHRSPKNSFSSTLRSDEKMNSGFSNAFTECLNSTSKTKTRINTQNQLLMNSLMEFYKVPSNMEKMIKTVNGDSNISLRIVHWFVTNYAKKYYTIYELDHADSSRFKVYNDYKLKLKAYSNRRFDPFCRWERTMLPLENNKYIETTIGQLNFFKWAIENNVIDYIDANYKEIEADMNLRNTTPKRKQINSRINTSISSIDSNSSTSSGSTTYSLEQINSFGEGSAEANNEFFGMECRKIGNDSFTVFTDEKTNSNTKTRKKRVELSVSACKCVKKENVNIVVKF
jgi:hypothetical protein